MVWETWVQSLGQVIPKKKIVLSVSLLNTQYYKVQIKSKWRNPVNGVTLSSILRFSSYRKRSLRVTLEQGQPTNIYIYIYSSNERPLIFSYRKMFLSYITCNERLLTFGYARLQKYFFNSCLSPLSYHSQDRGSFHENMMHYVSQFSRHL